MKNYYRVLGLASEKAANAEIEAAYQRLIHEFAGNPDVLQAVGEAFITLADPDKRALHDQELRAASTADQLAGQDNSNGTGLRWLGLVSLAVAVGGYFYTSRPKAPATAPLASQVRSPEAVTPVSALPQPEADRAVTTLPAEQEEIVILERPRPPGASVSQMTRGARRAGFDAEYLSWSTYLVVGGRSRGSGVMVAAGKILTNCHVVAGNALSGLVVINSATGERTRVDRYSKLEDDEDVCLLNAPGAPEYPVEWGRSETLETGAALHTVSFPGNEGLTWSTGQLLRRETPSGMEVLISSNYCRPGVSGGPLFDDKGRLMGVTSAGRTFRGGGGECMSLTAETARQVLAKPMVPIALAPSRYDPAMLRR